MDNQSIYIKTSLSFIFVLCAANVFLLCAVLNRYGIIVLGDIVLNRNEVTTGFIVSFLASFATAALLVKVMSSAYRKLTHKTFVGLIILVGLLFFISLPVVYLFDVEVNVPS